MNMEIKKFIYDENNHLIEEEGCILCEIENETGELYTIMMDKTMLIECDYEIPGKNINSASSNMQLQEGFSDEKEWSEESIKFLLDKYANYLDLVGPMKKFKNKRSMWLQIAEDLNVKLGMKKTSIQCENRYKTILKRKHISIKHNSTSGCKRVKVNFEQELNKIAAIGDSVEPEILQSANKVVINAKNSDSQVPHMKKLQKANVTIANTLLQIHKKKEAKEQERHEEKMKLLKSLFEKENSINNLRRSFELVAPKRSEAPISSHVSSKS